MFKKFLLKGIHIKRLYALCAWCALFIILTLATIFGESGEMGEMGRAFAMLNLSWFGYLGYVYLLFLIYPAYAIYKDSTLSPKRVKAIIAVACLSLGALLVQSIWLGKGLLGELLIAKITPSFGNFGVWILIIACFYAGAILLMPKQILAAQRAIQCAITGLATYLARNIKEAHLYLRPIITQSAKSSWCACKSWVEKVFASPEIKQFDRDIQGDRQESKDTAVATKSAGLDSASTNHTSQTSARHAQNTPFHLDRNANIPNQTPHNGAADVDVGVEFDERAIRVLYHDAEKEQRTKEQNEARHREMVRLVSAQEAQKVQESGQGEMLSIDVEQAISRTKAYEQEAPLQDKPTYHTKIITQTTPIHDSTPTNTHGTTMDLPQDFLPESSDSFTESVSFTPESRAEFALEATLDSSGPSVQDRESTSQDFIGLDSADSPNPSQESSTLLHTPSQAAPHAQPAQASTNPPYQKPLHTTTPTIVSKLESSRALLDTLDRGEREVPKNYTLPPTSLLQPPSDERIVFEEGEIDQKIQNLLTKLKVFKIDGDVARIYSGPVVTTFEFRPAPNVKVSRIQSLSDDLAMALSARSIRIQAPIPGKDVVGIEVPNNQREMIYLREILESDVFSGASSPLVLGLGKDIVGNPFVTDLQKLPHLLIAGTTGSGKSVGLNAMILSLLYRNSPDNLKLIMVDPKKVEFSLYEEIPHLLTPIITDAKKAIIALSNVAKEMERRYEVMKALKTKTIDSYNAKAASEGAEMLPFIVVIIDELADLMMTGGKEAEGSIIRIAQMGRAAGLHLIVATQRPSVDVVTGLIKTNLPAKIAYKVNSRMDSRVILDTEGAQNLLGQGDMLFSLGGSGSLLRLHAPWASEEEIESIVEFIKSQREVQYDSSFLADSNALSGSSGRSDEQSGEGDDLLEEAKKIMLLDGKTSISNIQRRLGVGYNKAASLVEALEKQGFLSAPNAKGVREIL